MIARDKLSEACLSRLQISQWALGDVSSATADSFATHVARCARCRGLCDAEKTSVEQAATMVLPAYVLRAQERGAVDGAAVVPLREQRAGTSSSRSRSALGLGIGTGRSWRGRVLGAAVALAACVLAMVFVRQDETAVRFKGQGALYGAIRRDGVVREIPLDSSTILQPGDGVRLRVPSGAVAWVLVQKRIDEGWQEVFKGHPDNGGWLPLSFTISQAPLVDVRIAVCSDLPPENPQADADLKDCSLYAARF